MSQGKGFVSYFINRPLLINIFLISVFIIGGFATTQMPRDQFPDVDLKRVSIVTSYPGASPEDVELKVTKVIEDKVRTVEGIKRTSSTSYTGLSMITVDILVDFPDPVKAKTDIRTEVKNAEVSLPQGAGTPMIQNLDPSVNPVVDYVISSDYLSEQQLRQAALDLDDQLRAIPGVKDIAKTGFRDREYQVFADTKKMNLQRVSLNDMSNAIQQYNLRSGGGFIDQNNNFQVIISHSLFRNIHDVANVIIRSNFEGEDIKLKDVSTLNNGFAAPTAFVRSERINGILLEVLKQGSIDIIKIVDKADSVVKHLLPYFKAKYGEQLHIMKTYDKTVDIKDILNITVNNGIQGFILVYLILIIFLDRYTAFWSAFNIPVTVCMTIVIIHSYLGFGFNMITLFGLITVLGIVVDQGIVVAENIYQKVEMGYSPKEASILGTEEISKAIMASVITTILSFLPLAFLGDIMGDFMRPLPLVIVIALICSTVEVFMCLPLHIYHSVEKRIKRLGGKVQLNQEKENSLGWFSLGYKGLLRTALKYRYITIVIFCLLFMFSIQISHLLRFNMFSDAESTEMELKFTAPSFYTLDQTKEMARYIEDKVVKVIPYQKELRTLTTKVGVQSDNKTDPKAQQPKYLYIKALLVPSSQRERGISEVVNEARKIITNDPYVKSHFIKTSISPVEAGPPSEADFVWRVSSKNDKLLLDVSKKLQTFIGKLKGVYFIENTVDETQNELGLYFRYSNMYRLGVDPDTVASTVSTAYSGSSNFNYIPDIDDPIYIKLSLAENYQRSTNQIANLLIPISSFNKKKVNQVKVGQVANLSKLTSQDNYFHYNARRTYTIKGFVDKAVTTPLRISAAIKKQFLPLYKNNPIVWINEVGAGEDMVNVFSGAKRAGVIAMVGIYLTLVLALDSFIQATFLMIIIPFSLVGVFFGFYFHGHDLGFFALIGILGLAGIVINHAVVLVDGLNQSRSNKSLDLSSTSLLYNFVVNCCELRLRPVLLTTVSTVFGLLSSIYGWGGSNDHIRPLAIALADGVLFGAFLSLILVPVLYLVEEDIKNFKHKISNLMNKQSA